VRRRHQQELLAMTFHAIFNRVTSMVGPSRQGPMIDPKVYAVGEEQAYPSGQPDLDDESVFGEFRMGLGGCFSWDSLRKSETTLSCRGYSSLCCCSKTLPEVVRKALLGKLRAPIRKVLYWWYGSRCSDLSRSAGAMYAERWCPG